MTVTAENYFSPEMQLKYMGCSQFKSFEKCEAAALAEIKGEWQRESTTALIVGTYIDNYFEGTLDIFQAQHPEIFTRQGALKSEYRQAEYIIERISRDDLFMKYMAGEKQVIKTGYIDGVPFKIKIDSYHQGKCIVDLKVMRDFEPIYVPGQGRLNFIEAWGYDYQAAIYQAIEGNNLPFYIAACTKQKEPDLAVIQIPQSHIDMCLELIKSKIQHYQSIKQGRTEPTRCEKCEYCRSTKTLNKIITLDDLDIE